MKKSNPSNLMPKSSLQNFTVSRAAGDDSPYKTYAVTVGENSFTVRKSGDHMWIEGDIVERHGDDLLNCIGCYIDNNPI